MCAGLSTGIEGTIHASQTLWDEHNSDENWGFLLIDASNAFNEGNRTVMLWVICHEWPAGATFAFNCYRHHAQLILRNGDGTASILYSREGTTQGNPISMYAYRVLLLPLICTLKSEFPEVYQPWYADDAGLAGSFEQIQECFERLEEIGPHYGYFPEPTKSILIVDQRNLSSATEEFEPFGFKISEGERYLGGFIGSPELQTQWVEDKMEEWKLAITNLAGITRRYPPTVYAGLTKSLQHEWQFLHRVVPELVEESKSLENSLTLSFLAALLKIHPSEIDYQMHRFNILPVKAAGLAFMDPTRTVRDSWISSTVLCGHIVAALRGCETFCRETHK